MGFGQYVISGQIQSLYVVNGGKHALELSRLLWGVPLATSEEARPFLEANYDTAAGDSLTDVPRLVRCSRGIYDGS